MTLAPADRRLLFGVLEPPEDHRLDHAIGTTFTLDLLALLRVPLAATTLPWSGPDGGRVENPFALLAALRQNAARISLYCHAGMTKVPAGEVPLLAFLEDCVHPVTPPRPEGVFHPKMWLLRFAPLDEDEPVLYRLVVLSRNLTFDRSWDTAVTFDGRLLDRQRGLAENRPLAAFIGALPGMAERAGTELPTVAADRARMMGEEVRRVRWETPEGFDTFTFHPIGHGGKPSWPVTGFHRLLVISPFTSETAIRRLRAEASQELSIVSRFETLAALDPALLEDIDSVDVFDELSAAVDGDGQLDSDKGGGDGTEEPLGDLMGLHAKVFVGKRGRRAVVFVGSANATEAAFEHNVEFVVDSRGQRPPPASTASTNRSPMPGCCARSESARRPLPRRRPPVCSASSSGPPTSSPPERSVRAPPPIPTGAGCSPSTSPASSILPGCACTPGRSSRPTCGWSMSALHQRSASARAS